MTCRKKINKSLAANNERIWFDEYIISPDMFDTEDMRDPLRLMGGSGASAGKRQPGTCKRFGL